VHDLRAPNSIIQALQQCMQPDSQPSTRATDTPSSQPVPVPEHSTSTAMPVVRPRPPRQRTPFPVTTDRNRYTSPKIPMRSSTLKAAQLMPVSSMSTVRSLQLASNTQVIPAQNTPPQEALKYTGQTRPHNLTLPVDQQSEQTDQMVQRWFERWSKHPENVQDTQDE
jgi:hypothetical protein